MVWGGVVLEGIAEEEIGGEKGETVGKGGEGGEDSGLQYQGTRQIWRLQPANPGVILGAKSMNFLV